MALFTDDELCEALLRGNSSLIKTLFHDRAEHISLNCIPTGFGERMVVRSATPLEREHNAERLKFCDLFNYNH